MKILVSSLFLLCLSGTYGMSITMQDEAPHPEPTPESTVKSSLKCVLHDILVLGAELVSTWESPEAERAAVLGKRVDHLKKSYLTFGLSLVATWTETFQEASKEFNETYPIYYNKAQPILQISMLNVFHSLLSAAEEIKPYFEKFEEQVKKHQLAFWEEVRPTIVGKVKPVIDALNANLKPYIDDVRKEVEAANGKEDSKSPSEQDPTNTVLEENIKKGEFLQQIAMFNKEVWRKIAAELQFFHTKA